MNVLVFGGFLGSGKTSLILSLAHFIVEKKSRRKLIIIENEIGQTGIDDKILRANGFAVKELFSGCICCTLAGELAVTLNEMAETMMPDWVIVECTGLADPCQVMKALKQLLEIAPVLIEKQVLNADVILMNKMDLAGEDHLRKMERELIESNGKAGIYKLSATGKINEAIWSEITDTNG